MSDDLVKRLRSSTQFYHADCELKMACAYRIEELEAKLAKAVDFIEDLLSGRDRDDDWRIEANAILAELKGQ